VDDAVEFPTVENFPQLFAIANVHLEKFEVGVLLRRCEIRMLDLRRIEIVEIIDDSYVPAAFGQQTINQVRTYESGSASYQNISIHDLLMDSRLQMSNERKVTCSGRIMQNP
jgi:hypothetical protein